MQVRFEAWFETWFLATHGHMDGSSENSPKKELTLVSQVCKFCDNSPKLKTNIGGRKESFFSRQPQHIRLSALCQS